MLTNLILLFLVFLFFLMLFYLASSFWGFLRTKVPFVPTHVEDIREIAKSLAIDSRHTFFDLGSGSGRVVFLIEKITGARSRGYEFTYFWYLWSVLKKRLLGSRAKFIRGDFFGKNWSEADFIYAYLYPPLMNRVEEKYQADCKPGTVAILRDFSFPNLKPISILKTASNHKIYIYKI